MCGFSGFVGGLSDRASITDAIYRMSTSLDHRGPDSSRTWIDPSVCFALSINAFLSLITCLRQLSAYVI